jgi:hypothetical protein
MGGIMRKHKIPISKVQDAFNSAIKRRDGRCLIKDYEPCCGTLECSHFFTVGASPSLRFYPLNAYTQCSRHHFKHHQGGSLYADFMMDFHQSDLDKMLGMKHKIIKYTDELKSKIIKFCNEDNLAELKTLIEGELV